MMLRLIPSIRPVFGRMQRFMCSEYVLPASPYAPESKYEQVESNNQKTTYFSFYLKLSSYFVQDKESVLASEHMDEFGRIYSTGKRKTSVARVWIKDGSGQFLINGKRATEYFTPMFREYAMSPLVSSKTAGYFDVWCTVKGGGNSGTVILIIECIIFAVFTYNMFSSGQAGAVRLGVARALDLWDPALRSLMREGDYF